MCLSPKVDWVLIRSFLLFDGLDISTKKGNVMLMKIEQLNGLVCVKIDRPYPEFRVICILYILIYSVHKMMNSLMFSKPPAH